MTVYSGIPILCFSIEGDTYFNDGQGGAMVATVLKNYEFSRGEVVRFDFEKSGGFDANDPNADFYNEYFQSDEAVFPSGNYTLYASFEFSSDADKVSETFFSYGLSENFTVE